jgi:hypothetical protein
MKRAGAFACALFAALIAAGCVAPQQPPPPRETERPRDALPDAYQHPPR